MGAAPAGAEDRGEQVGLSRILKWGLEPQNRKTVACGHLNDPLAALTGSQTLL